MLQCKGVPLHGKGSDLGVLECRNLYEELQKLREQRSNATSGQRHVLWQRQKQTGSWCFCVWCRHCRLGCDW